MAIIFKKNHSSQTPQKLTSQIPILSSPENDIDKSNNNNNNHENKLSFIPQKLTSKSFISPTIDLYNHNISSNSSGINNNSFSPIQKTNFLSLLNEENECINPNEYIPNDNKFNLTDQH